MLLAVTLKEEVFALGMNPTHFSNPYYHSIGIYYVMVLEFV